MKIKLGLPNILTIIFVVLKLTGAITWSWWWVLSPTLIGLGFAVIVVLLVAIAALIAEALKS